MSKEACVHRKRPIHETSVLWLTPDGRENRLLSVERVFGVKRVFFCVKRDFVLSKEACLHGKRRIHETTVLFDDTQWPSKQTFQCKKKRK